jgi:hypothetical protein
MVSRKAEGTFLARPAGGKSQPKNRLLITDSKQTEEQGQRRQAGFLWIREAGTLLPEECPESGAE